MPPPRAPTDFVYFDRKDGPRARVMRAASRAMLGFDAAPPDDVARTFGAMYYDADPFADALPDRSTADPEEAFASDLDPPAWLDRDQVERGARAFRRWGPDVFRFAGAITLQGYGEASVAKPLAMAGGYVGESARRRFLETARFWVAVSEPGGLEPGALGRTIALHVRLMHARIRKRLLASDAWDMAAWGVPISQADAILTLMGGSFLPGVAMHAMGYRTSAAEIESLMHFWRWIGHLMGVRPRWYPTSVREAAQLTFLTLFKGAHGAGDDGVRLCRSFAEAFVPRSSGVRARIDDGLHRGFTRFFLPRETHRRNGLPRAGLWALAPIVPFPLHFAVHTLRPLVPAIDEANDALQRRRRDAWLARL